MALGMRGAVPPWALVPRSGGRSRPPASSHSFSALPALKPLPAEEEELALFRQYREKRYSRSGDKNDKAIRGNRDRRPPPMEPHFHMETIRHNDGLDGASCDTVQSHGPAARVSMAGQNTKVSFSVHEPTGPATRVPMVRQNPKVSFEPTVPAARVPMVRQNPHVSFLIQDIDSRGPLSHGARPAFMQNFPRRQFPQFQPRSAPPESMSQGNVKEYAQAEDFWLTQNPREVSYGRRTEDPESNGRKAAAPQLSMETKLHECKETLQNGMRKTARVTRQMETPVEIKCEPSTEEAGEHPLHERPISIEAENSSTQDRLEFEQPASTLENHAVNEEVLVVDNESVARNVVELLMGKYKEEVHACDTEVAGIDVKKESPVGHGHLICFSIYCGPKADFGGGKCRIWVDVLKGGETILDIFRTYLEDPKIKKVWHNYSFDKHILGNHGIKASGFYADTMHLARLWDSARAGSQGGYSLEALTSDSKVMEGLPKGSFGDGKTSMKDLFAKTNIKKDGTEGKLKVIPPVEELQESEDTREQWIHYSAYDAVCTWHLWLSLRKKLKEASWYMESIKKGNMYDFYEIYWREFGNLLVQMEAEGMLVDRAHLAEVEKIALTQKQLSVSRFQKWASSYCADAIHMNVCSDAQIRQLLFGGSPNKKNSSTFYPKERTFKIPNTENFIEAGGKAPKKHRSIILQGIDVKIPVDSYTPSGWPAVNGAVLKSLAGNVAVDYEEEEDEEFPSDSSGFLTSGGVEGTDEEKDLSIYGKAYEAFGGGEAGKRACMAFAALCELSSIDTLISNFIQPLQCGQIVGADGRVHCSLNINTETGRLSARRPNLQNQPALEKDRYKIRHAFVASPGKSLIVADYGQLELRILAHLTGCQSMLEAFEAGGDFHSRTALNMYPHVRQAVNEGKVLLEWDPKPGETKPPVPLLKDMFGSERRKAKMLNFSIAYGKTAMGLSKDWKVSVQEAQQTLDLWYNDRSEVRKWQQETIARARVTKRVQTLLGRSRHLPDITSPSGLVRGHLERAAINTPVQGSAADVAMCAMLEINRNLRLKELGWKLILQVHDEVILEGPSETCEEAKDLVVKCMQFPFNGENFLRVKLDVDADFARSWYEAK